MKKIGILLIVMVLAGTMAAQVTIKRWGEYTDRGEMRLIQYDSLVSFDKEMFIFNTGIFNFDVPTREIYRISLPDTEENFAIMQQIEKIQLERARNRQKNSAIGCFTAGAIFIFSAQPIAYFSTKRMKMRNEEPYDDFSQRVTNTDNAIYWSFTGIGAILEIVGICQVVKFASGTSLKYGITKDGATITYRLKQ
ncbi:MAG: hypothetical protein LBH92_04695 [Bacteroidales bacterium]|jgi:hypothetical protein|nr:hypothetical protein [Bacteroidales bacterium]